MVSAWRHLFHGVIPVPVDGFPLAVLAPEDQGRSDHQLGRLGAAFEPSTPALDEDPVGHIAAHRQKGALARDFALTGHELRSYPLPALTDFGPAALDATPEPALAYGIGAERLAELIQERPQGIGSLLLHHEVLLSLCSLRSAFVRTILRIASLYFV